MNIKVLKPATILFVATLCAAAAEVAGSGHWEGTIQISEKTVKVTVDLARNESGAWVGRLAMPEQELTGVAASAIRIEDGSIYFESRESLLAVEGKLSSDGKSIEGGFQSAFLRAVPAPLRLHRVSEAVIREPAASTALSKSLQGTWQGSMKLGASWEQDDPRAGSTVAVSITMENGPDGVARGTLRKPGTNDPDLPLSAIQQSGDCLRFEVKGAGAALTADLKDGELTGEWKQFDLDPVPLKLRRAAEQ